MYQENVSRECIKQMWQENVSKECGYASTFTARHAKPVALQVLANTVKYTCINLNKIYTHVRNIEEKLQQTDALKTA
jgi:hypothetical protein